MSNEHQVGIYRLYKLGRLAGNRFDTSIKVLDADLHPAHHEYADKINSQSEMNGLLYELDEKATKLYWDKKPYRTVKEFTKFEEVIAEEDSILENEIEISKTEYIKPMVSESDKEAKVKELKAIYKKLTGKEAKQLWGIVKLTAEIDNLKQ